MTDSDLLFLIATIVFAVACFTAAMAKSVYGALMSAGLAFLAAAFLAL